MTFKLDESLAICLRAVASRYPDSLVEINKDILNRSDLWEGLCTVEQALHHLQVQAPQLLQAPARLLIDEGQAISAIYLLDRSQEVPAMHLYSGRYDGRPYRHGLHEPASLSREVMPFESHLKVDSNDLKKPLWKGDRTI